MGVVIIECQGAVLGMNLGRPIVTNGDYVSAEVEEPIKRGEWV